MVAVGNGDGGDEMAVVGRRQRRETKATMLGPHTMSTWLATSAPFAPVVRWADSPTMNKVKV